MNYKKYSVYVLVSLFMVFILAGCGAKDSKDVKDTKVNFPTKSITFLAYSSAGSPGDIYSRNVANMLQKQLGQPVVVKNITGAGGAVAFNSLLKEPADGYTIGQCTQSTAVGFNTGLFPTLKPDDFEYVAEVQTDPYLLAVRKDSKFQTLQDLIAFSKENPGKIKIGGFTVGSSPHIAFVNVVDKTGLKLEYIPYPGAADAVVATVGGHIDGVFTNPGGIVSQLKSGDLRVLAVTTKERLKQLPDVPTLKELGFDVEEGQWRGFIAKKGTPKEILKIYEEAVKKGIQDPEFQKYIDQTSTTAAYRSNEEFNAFMQSEIKNLGAVTEKLGLKKNSK